MERNYYTNQFLDEDFEDAAKSKEKKVQEKYTEQQLKDLYFDNAQKINQALISEKLNRHAKEVNRRSKRWMLEYLDLCIKENKSNLSYRDKMELKSLYVGKAGSNLVHLDFKTITYVPFVIAAALVVDVILSLAGLAKYYYYLPIITIFITYSQLKGLRRAKKEDKLLR